LKSCDSNVFIWIPSISKGWAESRSKFGSGDLDPACWFVHAERAFNHDLTVISQRDVLCA
jgi:hypothetical protein